jgi:mono/diheme cytochrome c family protein
MRKLFVIAVLALSAPAGAGNWNVPAAANKLKNPIKKNERNLKAAGELFSAKCARCHGESGRGDVDIQVPVGYDLRTILPDLTDGQLFWKVTHGVAKMPSFAGTLTERERWLVVTFMRTFDGPPLETKAPAADSGAAR